MIALLRGVADPAIRAEDVVIARESSDAESELRLVRPACTRTQPLICPTVLRLISNSPLSNNRMELRGANPAKSVRSTIRKGVSSSMKALSGLQTHNEEADKCPLPVS